MTKHSLPGVNILKDVVMVFTLVQISVGEYRLFDVSQPNLGKNARGRMSYVKCHR